MGSYIIPDPGSSKIDRTIEEHMFYILIDYKGHHWKASQFTMPMKSICYKNVCVNEHKCFIKHCRKVKK